MARWGTRHNKASDNVQSVSLLTAAASSPRRGKVYDISLGSAATPGDNAFIWIIQRCTTAGTGTTTTPNSLDPADTLACTIVATNVVTADPTLTANAFLYQAALNQRATFRWVAQPYGEILIPATASNGIMIGLSAASTSVMNVGVQFEEC